MTKEEYESLIPECCSYQTFEEHWERMGLCWGVTSGICKKGKECGRECWDHKDHDPELLKKIISECSI